MKYSLYGVLVHSGSSTHSGHYYCYVRTSNNMWYTLDDNRVMKISVSYFSSSIIIFAVLGSNYMIHQ